MVNGKLSIQEIRILRHLNDGDRIYRHWGRLTGDWVVAGDWGKGKVANTSVQRAIEDGLVSVTERIADWKYLRLTDAGKQALHSTKGEA